MFMETLEVDEFVPIMGTECEWYRYVDDVLVILPNQYCANNKLNELNSARRDIHLQRRWKRKIRYVSLILVH